MSIISDIPMSMNNATKVIVLIRIKCVLHLLLYVTNVQYFFSMYLYVKSVRNYFLTDFRCLNIDCLVF